GSTGHRRESLANDVARARRAAAARTPWHPYPASRIPNPAGGGGRVGSGLRLPLGGRRGGAPSRGRARADARSDLRREGARHSHATWNVDRATCGLLPYVTCPVTAPFPPVELTVFPSDCHAACLLNQTAPLP